MRGVGLHIPLATADMQPGTAVACARMAEAAGADSVWTIDRLAFGNYEPLVCLGAVAAATTRVRLGTSVLLAVLRPPALLAKMVATLDQLSGGRVTLGIGVGSRPDDFAAAGVPWEHRGSRAGELVRVLKLAWSGEPVRFHGQFYSLDVGPIGPRPVQRPHPPVWFGGNAESALRRVARIADGYIASSQSGPSGFIAAWEKVQGYAEAAGRDPASITPALLTYAYVDDDRERARAMAAAYFQHYYGPRPRSLEGYLLGPADECLRMAERYFEAGVQTLIIGCVSADLAAYERLCEQVVRKLR